MGKRLKAFATRLEMAALVVCVTIAVLQPTHAQCLQGIYSIGTGGDYPTIALAVDAISANGICGPVVFQIKDGTYAESLNINGINGTSVNTITFISESEDPEKVILESSNNLLLAVSNSSYITFQELTFSKLSPSTGSVKIWDSHYVSVKNNRFETTATGIIHLQASVTGDLSTTYIEVSGNTFTNGATAISLTNVTNAVILDNTIINPTTAILLSGTFYSQINKNLILTNNQDFENGISILGKYWDNVISNNEVISRDCISCLSLVTGFSQGNEPDHEMRIYNNIFNNRSATSIGSVKIHSTGFIKFEFNTVALGLGEEGVNVESRTMAIINSPFVIFQNNIVVNNISGFALDVYKVNSNSFGPVSDYNSFFTNGPGLMFFQLGLNSHIHNNLADWKAHNHGEQNSYSELPAFASADNLRILRSDEIESAGLQTDGISSDVDGEIRSSSPDIGADEFEYVPIALDAALMLPENFQQHYCYGWHSIEAIVKNEGTDPITSFNLNILTGNNAFQYQWNGMLPAGATTGVLNVKDFYFLDQSYFLSLELTDVNGATDDNVNNNLQQFNINVTTKPVAVLTGPSVVCDIGGVVLTASTGSPIWSDGTATDVLKVFTAGQYWFDHTLPGGCIIRSDTVTTTVNENLPHASFSFMTLGQTLFIENQSTNATQYTWDYGNGDTGQSDNPENEHVFNLPGTFDVVIDVANEECAVRKEKAIEIADLVTSIQCLRSDMVVNKMIEREGYLYIGGYLIGQAKDGIISKVNAETNEVAWNWIYHLEQDDEVIDLALDSEGNVYGALYSDFYANQLFKLDSNGELAYTRLVDVAWPNRTRVAVDQNDHVYFINGKYYDVIVSKYDENGGLMWARSVPSANPYDLVDASLDADGGLLVLYLETNGINLFFRLAKLSSGGDSVYDRPLGQRGVGGFDMDYIGQVEGTPHGVYSFAENFFGKTFVVKTNASGLIQWTFELDAYNAAAYRVDNLGNVFILYHKTLSGNPYLLKLNSLGALENEYPLDLFSSAVETSGAITFDSQNNVYCAVNSEIFKFTSSGTLIFTRGIVTRSRAIMLLPDNSVLTGGYHISSPSCSLVRILQDEHRQSQEIAVSSPFVIATYGGTNPALSATIDSGLGIILSSDDPTVAEWNGEIVVVKRAGMTTLRAEQPGNDFYMPELKEIPVTVNKAPLSLSSDSKVKTYGDPNPSLSFSINGFVGSDNASDVEALPSISTTAETMSDAGDYPITLSGGMDENYELVLNNATLTITKRTLPVTPQNLQKVYGDDNPPLPIYYGSFVGVDTEAVIDMPPTLSIEAGKNTPAGIYAIILTGGHDDNYEMVLTAGQLEILPAPLTVTAGNKTRVYGVGNPELTFSYLGFVADDDGADIDNPPSIATTAVMLSRTGVYPITLTGGHDDNYEMVVTEGQFEILPAQLTVTAHNKTRVYGVGNPELTFSYVGFVADDDGADIDNPPSIATTAVMLSRTGVYPITLTSGHDDNYEMVLTEGQLEILPAPLTVTAHNKARLYGDENPELTFSYEGFVADEYSGDVDNPPAIETTAENLSNAGTYPITLTGGSDDNYELLKINAEFTINKSPQSIIFEPVSEKLETDAAFNLTAHSSSGLTVSFTSLNNVITINNNEVTINSPGAATITAFQPGNENYHPADPVNESFEIHLVTGTARDTSASIDFYPNPVKSGLFIQSPKPGISVIFMDAMGRKVSESVLQQGVNEISTYLWSGGLYIGILKDENIITGYFKVQKD